MFYALVRRKFPLITYAKRLKHCYFKLKMNTAYFRHVEGENQFHVSFLYVDSERGVNKQFNFSRSITENCSAFLNRVAANIEKVVAKKKRKSDADTALPSINVSLTCNGVKRDEDFPCSDLFAAPQGYTLNIQEQVLPIQVNSPWVETIALPKLIMSGFLVTPSKFETFFVDRSCCTWKWYHSIVQNGKWVVCGEEEMYCATPDDVGKYLRVVCQPKDSNGRCGPDIEASSPSVVQAGPGTLPCEARHKFTSAKMHNNGFRIVSYNILADLYADQEYSRTVLFGYCVAYALELSYRRQLLFKELMGFNADLICLQEVDTKVFRHDLEPFLKKLNMNGVHSPKGESVGEGTAIFYDSHKFKQIKNWRIVLGEDLQKNPIFSDLWEKIRKNENLATRVADRSTTLQILLLESLVKTGKLVLIANIHLYFHPDADHIRLLQSVTTTIYLENLLKELKQEFPSHEISLIWCGDFNSVPECGIYQLLVTHGHVPDNHPDWRSKAEEAVENVSYETHLQMGSACGTPQYTNYTVAFKACLDYIFYEKAYFDVEQVVPFPSEEELSLNLGIPSMFFPSDHIALVSDLRWKK